MIKIDIDAKLIGRNKIRIEGPVEVHGDIERISNEIYAILQVFERQCPEALINAIDMKVGDMKEEE